MAEQRMSFRDWLISFPIFNFLIVVMLALFLLQVLAYLISLIYPPAGAVKLGWVILVLAAAVAVWLAIQIIDKRIIKRTTDPFTRGEVFVLLAMIAAVVVALIYLPPLVPQVFSQSVIQLHSIVRLP